MDRHINCLYKCRKEILEDLDVHDVVPNLLSQLVLDHRDKQLIDYEKSLEDKAEKLLEILEDKATTDSTVIPAFVDAVQEKYAWIYKRLKDEDVTDSNVIPLPKSSPRHQGLRNKLLDCVRGFGEISTPDQKMKLMEAGGVPCLPPFVVERKGLLQLIRDALEGLGSSNYVVLQGMAGSGKSVLAAQSVADWDLIQGNFEGGVYWLSVGKECSESKDALFAKLRVLCERLGESKSPTSMDHGADVLRTAILKRLNILLILDDVWRADVIRAFDVGCRIFVTTRDLSVMDAVNGRYTVIKVDEGFTEDESLLLFAQTLNIEQDSVPHQARLIHRECKGSPMVISLISSLIKEHVYNDPGRWQYYLDTLVLKKYSKVGKFKEYAHQNIVDAISLSFEALSDTNKKLYSDLAMFPRDFGIPCPVLMTVWNKQKYEVEDIMKNFVKKSLVTEEYDQQKKHFVYSVHDLLLDYLKIRMSSNAEWEVGSHRLIVERYFDTCSNEFHRLPDDGYIYFFLGYHLYKSKMHHYFKKIYFDLQFIGEKLRVAGPADLLVDIRKYSAFIVEDDEEKLKHIEEIKTFAQLVGHRMYGQLDNDVIQIALQTPHLTWIHNQAKLLAQSSGNRLYLEWKNPGQWKHPESTVLCSDHVCCLKFVGSGGGHFVAGLSNGLIQLCELESSSILHIFFGHTDVVHSLDLFPRSSHEDCATSQDSCHIVSASADKTCKLWDLSTVLSEFECKPYELRTGRIFEPSPSPKFRPDRFETHENDSVLTFYLHTAPVTFAQYSGDGNSVISTSTNEIMIWCPANGQIISKFSLSFINLPKLTFQKCLFATTNLKSNFLLCSAENQLVLISEEQSSLYTSVEAHPMRIVEVLLLEENFFCTVSETEVGLWKLSQFYPKEKSARSRSLSPSKCLQFFSKQADPKLLRAVKTLDPQDIKVHWNSHHEAGDESVVKSSSVTNGSLRIPPSGSLLCNRNFTIQITREEILPNKARGFLLCAAIGQGEDGNGKLLACGTSDHSIALWNIDKLQYLGSFTSHNGWVTCLNFSPVDACAILSGSEDRTIMCWDIQAEEKGTKEPQKCIEFSSIFIPVSIDDGYFLSAFYTESNTVQIYTDIKLIYETNPFDDDIISILVSVFENVNHVTLGTVNGKVYEFVVDLSDGRKKKQGSIETKLIGIFATSVVTLNYCMLGKHLVVGLGNDSFVIIEDKKLNERFTLENYFKVHFMMEKFLVGISHDSSVTMVNLQNKSMLHSWNSAITGIHVICTDSCSTGILALGTANHGVIVLKLSELEISEKSINPNASSPIRSVAVNSSCLKVAIGYDSGLISVWSIVGDSTKEIDLLVHKSWVRQMRFSPQSIGNSHWLISCGDSLVVWNLEKPELPPRKISYLTEKRRRKSGESPSRISNRLSLEIPDGNKIGRQGKRELLQKFSFCGNHAQHFVTDPRFEKIVTVDDARIFYLLETLKCEGSSRSRLSSAGKV